MKVLHLPSSCGGNAWRLAQGEKALGLASQVLYTHGHWTGYPCDLRLGLSPDMFGPAKALALLRAFVRLRGMFDVFHFNYGSSLVNLSAFGLHHPDLPFYPAKARLFATYQGCDVRERDLTLARRAISACADPDCYGGACNSRTDMLKRKAVTAMTRHVRHIFALNPDLLHFLPAGKASFLPYSMYLDERPSIRPDFGKPCLRIVHAPTDRACKGTKSILVALNQIKKERPGRIEVELVEGLPHSQALERIRQADIVVDQVLVGWYGGVAAEAMALGKAVVCRIEEQDLGFIPPPMAGDLRQAMIWSGPGDLAATLLSYLDNPSRLTQTALAGQEYVHRWHDARAVARITRAHYEA